MRGEKKPEKGYEKNEKKKNNNNQSIFEKNEYNKINNTLMPKISRTRTHFSRNYCTHDYQRYDTIILLRGKFTLNVKGRKNLRTLNVGLTILKNK